MIRRPPRSTRTDTLFPYTTLFRSSASRATGSTIAQCLIQSCERLVAAGQTQAKPARIIIEWTGQDGMARKIIEENGCLLGLDQAEERAVRSEERRVGKACDRTCRTRWSTYYYNTQGHRVDNIQ